MTLATDLLDQARHLATFDTGRPKQANLRRSVSSAYYAIFHLLGGEAARRISPSRPTTLPARIARSPTHGDIKKVCVSISESKPSTALKELHPASFSPELRAVASMFVRLQEARNRADYDTTAIHDRLKVLALIRDTEDAFTDWNRIRASDEATVFLAALLFAARWDR